MIISVLYKDLEKERKIEIENFFIASRTPLYIGLIIKPSKGLWEYLKNHNDVIVSFENEKESYQFDVEYKIEVGENTIFFINANEEYENELKKKLFQ